MRGKPVVRRLTGMDQAGMGARQSPGTGQGGLYGVRGPWVVAPPLPLGPSTPKDRCPFHLPHPPA